MTQRGLVLLGHLVATAPLGGMPVGGGGTKCHNAHTHGCRARGPMPKGDTMSEFDLTDPLRKLFLMNVGAVATVAEKSEEVVSELVKKGELTVEQGKTLNSELTRKAREVVSDTTDAVLRSQLESMTPEERAAYAAKVAQMAADIDAKGAEPAAGADADAEPAE